MMLSMAFFGLKKFLSILAGGRSLLVGLAVLVCAGLTLLWQLEQEILVQIIITVILGGFGLDFARRQTRATEKNTSVAQDNVRVAQEGHLTERFARAIEQLGDDNLTIRLGGISALERIAKDSEKDHGPIMEVLTAYVREKAPRKENHKPQAGEKPPTDIQAILTVIGRRKTTEIKRLDDFLDLSHTHLAGVHLEQANLSGLNLGIANLNDARLNGADLNNTILVGANLSKVWLGGAKNLTAEQVQSAQNWREACLPASLKYLKDLPDPPA